MSYSQCNCGQYVDSRKREEMKLGNEKIKMLNDLMADAALTEIKRQFAQYNFAQALLDFLEEGEYEDISDWFYCYYPFDSMLDAVEEKIKEVLSKYLVQQPRFKLNL